MRPSFTWLSLLCVCACDAGSPASLSWSLRFANADTAARARSVEVSIVAGSCSSEDIVYAASITRQTEGDAPPRLRPGGYALLGRAITDDCGLIAYGCVQTMLPVSQAARIEIVLDDVAEQPVCTGACAAHCEASEATPPPDAQVQVGRDAAMGDAGVLRDAGPGSDAEASVDAGPSCDGMRGPNAHCYAFNATALTFQAAEAECVSWGGHLVSFNDAAEELWVSDAAAALGTLGDPTRFWIGFSDSAAEGVWTWSDNSGPASTVTFNLADPTSTRFKTTLSEPYTHWGPNPQTTGNREPNNGVASDPAGQVPGEDCAESRGSRSSGPDGISPRAEWDDQSCSSLKPSVCERQ